MEINKTAKEIAEHYFTKQEDIDKLEYDILRYMEYHYIYWLENNKNQDGNR